MYNYIKGKLAFADENTAVVEAGGVGYELCVSSYCLGKLGAVGDDCKVYCYLNVKEDEMSLYGFADREEKALFTKLIGVSGIGCKMAIAILSSANPAAVLSAIASADVSSLSKIKGIGKKTAERIVVELRDKLTPFPVAATPANVAMPQNDEAVDALLSLGYTRQEALAAISRVVKPNMTTEQIVFAALKG